MDYGVLFGWRIRVVSMVLSLKLFLRVWVWGFLIWCFVMLLLIVEMRCCLRLEGYE